LFAELGTPVIPWAGYLNDDDIIDLIHPGPEVRISYGHIGAGGELEFEEIALAETIPGLREEREHGLRINRSSVVDYDGDNDWDLILHTGNAPKRLLFLENEGGQLHLSTELERELDMDLLGACDLDADGRNDLVFDIQDSIGYALRGRGAAPYAPLDIVETQAGTLLNYMRLDPCRDMDGDGLDDLVFPDFIAGTSYVLYNRSR
jgi:hypothetical protein